MPNQITLIKPYKWHGQWLFDDDRIGLIKEPFVSGADTLLALAAHSKKFPNPDQGLLLFSKDPFPTADLHLRWLRHETGGNIYQWNTLEAWLCPALLLYFQPPANIYAQLKPLPHTTQTV